MKGSGDPNEGLGATRTMSMPSPSRGPSTISVALQRAAGQPSEDQGLWIAIRNRTQAISFERYSEFVNLFLEDGAHSARPSWPTPSAATHSAVARMHRFDRVEKLGVDGYNLLRLATEAFLLFEAGLMFYDSGSDIQPSTDYLIDPNTFLNGEDLDPGQESARLETSVGVDEIKARLNEYFQGKVALPYLDRIMVALTGIKPVRTEGDALSRFNNVLKGRLINPSMIELIWSYWHEEGMLVQSINAIALRFQNRRSAGAQDPLANLELDSLRPLNNTLWGYIQSSYTRLTVSRRAYEYDHHYGLTLIGKAVPELRSADSRSKFLEAFHNLLYRASSFFAEDSDTTVVADGFPLLNSLRELHMIMAEGAHNQFGDLPWTARAEMMVEQWLLARPEMKEFLRGRAAVPYQEPWIGVVDAMKRIQGWGDTTSTHFHELAVTGEQLLLTVRYNDWSDLNFLEEQAKNWARYWKNEIQRYMHAYRAVTGVDLTTEPVDTRAQSDRYAQPSSLLGRRMTVRDKMSSVSAPAANRALSEGSEEYVAVPASTNRNVTVRRKS